MAFTALEAIRCMMGPALSVRNVVPGFWQTTLSRHYTPPHPAHAELGGTHWWKYHVTHYHEEAYHLHIIQYLVNQLTDLLIIPPIEIDVQAPLWFGGVNWSGVQHRTVGIVPPPPDKTTTWKAAYRHWPHTEKLCDQLRARGVHVEIMPWFIPKHRWNLIQWIRGCELLVTPESGPHHVAAALGIPSVVIAGDRFTRDQYGYPSETFVSSGCCPYSPYPCAVTTFNALPCKYDIVYLGRAPCVDLITVDDVMETIERHHAAIL